MTQTQHISGSVAYMAPERLRGELSTRSIDVFALGVMFFELHKGYRPFPGNNKTKCWRTSCAGTSWIWTRIGAAAIPRAADHPQGHEPRSRRPLPGRFPDAVRPAAPFTNSTTGTRLPRLVLQDFLTRGAIHHRPSSAL